MRSTPRHRRTLRNPSCHHRRRPRRPRCLRPSAHRLGQDARLRHSARRHGRASSRSVTPGARSSPPPVSWPIRSPPSCAPSPATFALPLSTAALATARSSSAPQGRRHPRRLPRPARRPDRAGRRSLSDVDQVVLDEADRMADMGFMPAVRRILDQTARTARPCCSRPPSTATSPSSPVTTRAIRSATRSARDPRHHLGQPRLLERRRGPHRSSRPPRPSKRCGQPSSSAAPVTVPTVSPSSSAGTASTPRRSTAVAARVSALALSPRSPRARSRRWSPPTSPPAASTSTAWPGCPLRPAGRPQDYVHRSGRTARAGEGGVVVSLIQGDQKKDMSKMQRQIDLNEPLTDPNVKKMTSLSATDELVLAPPRPGQDQQGGGQGQANRRRSGQGKGHGKNGSRKRSSGGGSGGQARNGQGGGRNKQGSRSGGQRQNAR